MAIFGLGPVVRLDLCKTDEEVFPEGSRDECWQNGYSLHRPSRATVFGHALYRNSQLKSLKYAAPVP